MVHITIDKKYSIPESWEEISLDVATKLFTVPMPESLMEYYKQKLEKESPIPTSKELVKIFPKYYGEILSVFGVPKHVVNKISPIDRTVFYNQFLLEFVLGVHFSPTIDLKKPEFIECDGEKLYFPKSKMILGHETPMAYTTAWEFSEMADLQIYSQSLAEGKYGVLANIASIMCRPIGEEYDEDKSLARAEKLKEMNMADGFEVFFCFLKQLSTQTEHDQMYLRATLAQRLKLPLKVQGLVRGQAVLSKWAKQLKGLKRLKNRTFGISST